MDHIHQTSLAKHHRKKKLNLKSDTKAKKKKYYNALWFRAKKKRESWTQMKLRTC